jgi:hypothetical protein
MLTLLFCLKKKDLYDLYVLKTKIMKIKTKLNLGVGSLFLMIIILVLVSAYYIFSIKKDTENILKANYNTL